MDKIDKAEVVSFDMFDTLIIRSIYKPSDLFLIMEKETGIKNFSQLREEAQTNAFKQMHREKRREISIDDIYRQIDLPADRAELIKELEIELELNNCKANNDFADAYKYARNKGKRIIIISDMYLDGDSIEKILNNCGFLKFDRIYVSSEFNANKRDGGDLYSLMLEDLQINPERVLHIGDNKISDIRIPNKLGIKTYYYPKVSENYSPVIFESDLVLGSRYNGFIVNSRTKSSFKLESPWFKLGYKYGGLLHIGFLSWLHQRFRDDNIEKVLFLSRDGYLLDKLYKKYYPESTVASSYFYGSRVSFSLASVKDENYAQYIDFFISGYDQLSLFEIFDRANLPLPSWNIIRKCGFKGYDDKISSPAVLEKLKQLFVEIRPMIVSKCNKTKNNLKEYLIKEMANKCKIAIVDVGWSGSTQLPLNEFVIKELPNIELKGYYMALLDSQLVKYRMDKMDMIAFVCSPFHNRDIAGMIEPYKAIIELFFSAPHDSVIDYIRKMDEVVPVFCKNNSGSTDYNFIFNEINSGISSFMDTFNYYEDIAPGDAMAPMLKFINNMGLEEKSLFKTLYNFDTWSSTGNVETSLCDLVELKV